MHLATEVWVVGEPKVTYDLGEARRMREPDSSMEVFARHINTSDDFLLENVAKAVSAALAKKVEHR